MLVYSCGEGEQHQNGHSETMKQWTKIDFHLPVCEVAGGKYHTILLTGTIKRNQTSKFRIH